MPAGMASIPHPTMFLKIETTALEVDKEPLVCVAPACRTCRGALLALPTAAARPARDWCSAKISAWEKRSSASPKDRLAHRPHCTGSAAQSSTAQLFILARRRHYTAWAEEHSRETAEARQAKVVERPSAGPVRR
eukprot:scaffold2695_cov239-Pinguiococcus_pyrenoidosus.AAC.3